MKNKSYGTPDIDHEFMAYLKMSKAERLMYLQEQSAKADTEFARGFWEGRMIEASIGLDEHPEGFNCGCMCNLCRSYA
jgi:hypothetical protein